MKTKQAEYRAFNSYGFLRLIRYPIVNGEIQPGTQISSTADPETDGLTMVKEEVQRRVQAGEETL